MSQIFEALKRSRQYGHADRAGRSAQADAVLATMGFASERKRSPREQLAPVILLALLAIGGWLVWRSWDAGRLPDAAPQQPAVHRPPAQAPAPATPGAGSSAPAAPAVPLPAATATGTATQPRSAPPIVARASRRQDAVEDGDPGFSRALRSHRSGDLDAAILYYRGVLERSPRDVRAHNNLGLAYRDKGLLDEAAGHFQRALSVDPAYATARNNLAATLLGLGRPDYAAAELRRVLARDPANVDALVNLALAERAAGRRSAAHELLLQAAALEPQDPIVRYNLAVAYDEAGEPSRALEHYRAFLDRAAPAHAARVEDVRRRVGEITADPCGARLKPCATAAQPLRRAPEIR